MKWSFTVSLLNADLVIFTLDTGDKPDPQPTAPIGFTSIERAEDGDE